MGQGLAHIRRVDRSGKDGDRRVGRRRLQPVETLEPVHARHVEVEEDQVAAIALLQQRRRLVDGGGLVELHGRCEPMDEWRQRLAHEPVVVSEDHPQRVTIGNVVHVMPLPKVDPSCRGLYSPIGWPCLILVS